MQWAFNIVAVLTLLSAAAALSLRNLVHCALCLAGALGGLAVLFLQLNAQFVGLAQILVYVGAVAILVVFAILLTRGADFSKQPALSPSWVVGAGVAVLVLGSLVAAIRTMTATGVLPSAPPLVAVRDIGARLMAEYVLPLEVVGLLLTVALIGGVVIALQEKRR
ncbi:MAG: NADH-quinone oxidoreductase subunit J [Verrucomicrobia bacterium]|nr:NADH-quinone oxidoreductase subunit J [Verrucomicrobiota bacterium]